jgi:leucyl aminopeptidase
VGEYVWRLPLWDEYLKYTKGVHGDIANIQSSGNARYGGAINGGAFLSHFTSKYPWAHIDMAPRMTPAPGDCLAKGATGEPTALLIKIAESY